LTQADPLGHNRFTGVASLRARYRHRPESLSTSRRNALSTSPEYAAIPGCATQGETYEELLANLHEAIAGCLSVEVETPKSTGKDQVVEITL